MPMHKKSMVILLVIVLAAAAGTIYGLTTQNDAEPLSEATAETATPNEISVYVTGAVNKPGIVTVKEGARVADAINACGGLLPTSDGDKVNMAQKLKDGQQIRVPEKAEGKPAESAKSGTAKNGKTAVSKDGKVNINTADEQELDCLPGIGPAMAKRIVEYRETNGAFQAPEDIKNVKGIGDAKFEKMKDMIEL